MQQIKQNLINNGKQIKKLIGGGKCLVTENL